MSAGTSPGAPEVSFGKTLAEGVRITSPHGETLRITSADLAGGEFSQAAPGVATYNDAGAPAEGAVQVSDDGSVRVLALIEEAEASEEYRFDLDLPPGMSLALVPDGSIEIINSDGLVMGTIAKPWATAANGSAVPTHYRLQGTQVTQIIEHKGATSICLALPPGISYACIGAMLTVQQQIDQTAQQAYEAGDCLEVQVSCAGIPVGWGPHHLSNCV